MRTIVEAMNVDHAKLSKMLDDLQQNFEGGSIKEQDIKEFRWLTERHFLTEEKAILLFYKPEDKEIQDAFDTILEQHRTIRKKVEDLGKDLRQFEVLKRMLLAHRSYEDFELYPRLDHELDAKTQEQIIKRIEQSIQER